jgi:hypothetical protein
MCCENHDENAQVEARSSKITRREFMEKSAKIAAVGAGVSTFGNLLSDKVSAQTATLPTPDDFFEFDSINMLLGDDRTDLMERAIPLLEPMSEFYSAVYGIEATHANHHSIRYTNNVSTFEVLDVKLIPTQPLQAGHKAEGSITVIFDLEGNYLAEPVVKGIYYDSIIDAEPGDPMHVIAALYNTVSGELKNWDFITPSGGGFEGVPEEILDDRIIDSALSGSLLVTHSTEDPATGVPNISFNVSCEVCEQVWSYIPTLACHAIASILAKVACDIFAFICTIFFQKACLDVYSSLVDLLDPELTCEKACAKIGVC